MAVSSLYINAVAPGQADYYGADLVTGISALSNRHLGAAAAQTTQVMNVTYFRSPKTFATTQVKMCSGTVAATGLTLARMGLYAVNPATGALTSLLGSTANDTSIFAVANTVYTKSWSAGFSLSQGVWYGLAVLQVGTTPSQLICSFSGGNALLINTTLPRLTALVAGQADLPASVAAGSLSAANVGPWGEIV